MKGSLRLLRLKEKSKFEKYEFLTYPTKESIWKTKDPKTMTHVCFVVVFLFQNAFNSISKTIDWLLSQNPQMEISVVTGFSNLKYLVSLSHEHRNIDIYNVLLIADFRKFYISLKSNCEDGDFPIMDESNYHDKLLKLARRYQKKHSAVPLGKTNSKIEWKANGKAEAVGGVVELTK